MNKLISRLIIAFILEPIALVYGLGLLGLLGVPITFTPTTYTGAFLCIWAFRVIPLLK